MNKIINVTLFQEALGDTPVIRVLDFLIEGRELDYSLTNITENANIGWTTLHNIWENLISSNMIIHTRTIGRAKLFRINKENNAAKKLIQFYDTLLKENN